MTFEIRLALVGDAAVLPGGRPGRIDGDERCTVRGGELQRIYVDRGWQGQGVGDALMARSIEQARAWACDAAWLSVWQENARAIAFYRRSGFETVGVQTFAIGGEVQHDYIMTRPLP